jgi:hypothetical protein
MTATCIHCHVVITLPPIIGADPQQQQVEFYKELVKHVNASHAKQQKELFEPVLLKIARMEKTLLNLTGVSQFTSYDPDWGKDQAEAFGEARRIFEEFKPKDQALATQAAIPPHAKEN